ncbi:venom allergen 3 homolog isoform X2 [Anabrus simplex]|uniref:venom allergen 3 homolog isoform X2 n=1 Tax=Anabrus simplex TaxID=316456 RepID=UPI0034DD090C
MGVSNACSPYGKFGVKDDQKTFIVDLHNRLRNRVASGRERRGLSGPQPQASNMKKLIWDDDVAEVAQRWADQCRKGHDQCRNDRRFGVGQSVFWTRKTRCHEAEWEHAIRSWYREVRNLPLSTLRSYKKTDVGHYTQLVWANTEVIGCGYRTRNRPRGCETFYVCNYGRGGNMKTQKVYQIGPPRFACRNSPVDPKYPALC